MIVASDLPLGLRRLLRPGQYLTAKTETEDSVEELLAPRGGQPDRGRTAQRGFLQSLTVCFPTGALLRVSQISREEV